MKWKDVFDFFGPNISVFENPFYAIIVNVFIVFGFRGLCLYNYSKFEIK